MTREMTAGVLAAVLLAIAAPGAQETSGRKSTAAATIEATIVANERALFDAAVKGDKAAFESLVLQDGVWTTSRGFVPLNLLVNGLGSFSGITKREIVNPHVKWLDEGSAILLYVRTGTGTFEDQPLAPTALASTVWTKRDGKWLAAYHQETDVTR